MVYMSGGKMARHIPTITNIANAGGGSKKGGLPPTVGHPNSHRPSLMLRCAPQLPFIPVGNMIPCFPISTTVQLSTTRSQTARMHS